MIGVKATLAIDTIEIQANTQYAKQLRNIIEENWKSFSTTNLSRWGFHLADLITRITFLNKLNFPKIKQMTSFGNNIMSTSAAVYNDIASYTDWTFPSILELTELRTRFYTNQNNLPRNFTIPIQAFTKT